MILKTKPGDLLILNGGPGPIHSWANVSQYAAVANASMFQIANGNPVGGVVSNGKVLNRFPKSWPLFRIVGGKPEIIEPWEWHPYSDLNKSTHAVSCAPLLVWEGKPTNIKAECERSRIKITSVRPDAATGRTAIGLDANGTVILLVDESATLYEVQKALLDAGAVSAFNLDGGGSSVLYRDGKRVLGSDVRKYPSAIALTGLLDSGKLEIKQDILPTHSPRRTKRNMKPKYITVHGTANPGATAKNHANLLKGASWNPSTGWHVTVDDVEAIQHIPFDEAAYHAGDGEHGIGNSQSVGIEICEFNEPERQEKAIDNAVKVVQTLMQRLNISPDNVVPHHHWTRKDCPRILLDEWDTFIKRVKGLDADVTTPNVWTGQILRKGDKGLAVHDLQAMLKAALFDPGPIDGIFGPATDEALRRAQKALGLVVDGLAGPATLQALRTASSRAQPRKGLFYIKSGPFGDEADVDTVIEQLKRDYPGKEWSKINATP